MLYAKTCIQHDMCMVWSLQLTCSCMLYVERVPHRYACNDDSSIERVCSYGLIHLGCRRAATTGSLIYFTFWQTPKCRCAGAWQNMPCSGRYRLRQKRRSGVPCSFASMLCFLSASSSASCCRRSDSDHGRCRRSASTLSSMFCTGLQQPTPTTQHCIRQSHSQRH